MSTKKNVKIDIYGSDGKEIIKTYRITKMNIAQSVRQHALLTSIVDDKSLDDNTKNVMSICARLICCLKDGDGKLVYPPSKSGEVDDSVVRCIEEMDEDLFNLLCEANAEVNPVTTSLKVKKRKY